MGFDFRFTQIKLLSDDFAKLETFAVANRSPFTRSQPSYYIGKSSALSE